MTKQTLESTYLLPGTSLCRHIRLKIAKALLTMFHSESPTNKDNNLSTPSGAADYDHPKALAPQAPSKQPNITSKPCKM